MRALDSTNECGEKNSRFGKSGARCRPSKDLLDRTRDSKRKYGCLSLYFPRSIRNQGLHKSNDSSRMFCGELTLTIDRNAFLIESVLVIICTPTCQFRAATPVILTWRFIASVDVCHCPRLTLGMVQKKGPNPRASASKWGGFFRSERKHEFQLSHSSGGNHAVCPL